MRASERLEAIAQHCRVRHNPYPESLITAICQYVAGEGSLAHIQQQWKLAGSSVQFSSTQFIVVSDPAAECLDELDLRVLDICMATDSIRGFFRIIAEQGPIEQAYQYLLSQGVDERLLLRNMILVDQYLDKSKQVTALGKLLLSLLPAYSGKILTMVAQAAGGAFGPSFIELLLAARPTGYLDLASRIALTAQQQAPTDDRLGSCAALLVKHDYARFRKWARQIAGPASPGEEARIAALQALLECDEATNIDLAVEAARAPLPSYGGNDAKLQHMGLVAAYRYDPVKYLPLVGEAAMAPNEALRRHAFMLLKEVDFEQARPVLQRCVANGVIEAALEALDVLLEHEWPERQAYMLSLLSHRSKKIRDALIELLAKTGEGIVEALAPSLAHPNADARLAAVQALQRIGGAQVHTLLAARLDVEKSLKVRQAILDVVGVAAVADSSQAEAASPVEALSAEAEATLNRVAKPILPWFDAAQMPGLRWKNGEAVPQVVVNYLLSLQSRGKQSTLDARIQQALPLIDRSSSGDLALTLFNGWLWQGAASAEAWCLPLACALADERLIHPLRQSIDGWARGVRGAIAAKAVAAMALIESDLALAEINDLAERAKHSLVKAAAQQALTDAANQRNTTMDELADLIVPNLGFGEQGQRLFDYGPRQFTVRLQLDQTIQITDSAGKRLTTLPKPGVRDEATKANAAQAAWSLLKKQVPQVMKLQEQRLENALINQRAWSVARWQALFLNHPVLRSFAITLIWGVVASEPSRYQIIFRPLEDGTLTDAEDTAIELPAKGQIRLVHPVELDEDVRSAWLQHLADYEVTPPFPQLNRPIVCASPEESGGFWWEKYKGYLMNGGALKGRFLKAGWERGSVQDGGAYYTIWKAFPAAGIQAVLETAGLRVGNEQAFNTAIIRLAFSQADSITRGSYVYDDLEERDERIIKLGDVPPSIFSEIAADVQTFAAAGEYAEDWERKVW